MLIRGVYGMFVHEEYGMHIPELYAGMLTKGLVGVCMGYLFAGVYGMEVPVGWRWMDGIGVVNCH